MNSPSPPARLTTSREDQNSTSAPAGFTLVELLVVISIIVVLGALAFPAFRGVLDSAKKTQAKNDLLQIVTAVNSFYTEYGQYPCTANNSGDAADYVAADTGTIQRDLVDNLTAAAGGTLNTRQIRFLTAPNAKEPATPRSGIGSDGRFYDPWGSPYRIKIDNNYNNTLTNPYTANTGAGPASLNVSVIGFSFGKNGSLGGGSASNANFAPEPGSANQFTRSGDVISWQ